MPPESEQTRTERMTRIGHQVRAHSSALYLDDRKSATGAAAPAHRLTLVECALVIGLSNLLVKPPPLVSIGTRLIDNRVGHCSAFFLGAALM